jgi:hypothetical protein
VSRTRHWQVADRLIDRQRTLSCNRPIVKAGSGYLALRLH